MDSIRSGCLHNSLIYIHMHCKYQQWLYDGNIVITGASFAHHTDASKEYLKVYLVLI